MLEVHGLVKIYGTRRVVDGVDFRVAPGEIVGLLGPNGAGKTTSFRMTCGMIEPNKGKVILLEPIGMSCAACQAFCGGHEVGGFANVQPQADLPSIEKSASKYGIDFNDERVVRVHLLLYNPLMKAPSHSQTSAWAKHFNMDRAKNQIVLAGLPSMAGSGSTRMIPSFHLIDQNFMLRGDDSSDLYRQLLPKMRGLLRTKKGGRRAAGGGGGGGGGEKPVRKRLVFGD